MEQLHLEEEEEAVPVAHHPATCLPWPGSMAVAGQEAVDVPLRPEEAAADPAWDAEETHQLQERVHQVLGTVHHREAAEERNDVQAEEETHSLVVD